MSNKQIPESYPGKQYQPLFDYLHKECGVLVLPNGMSDIIEIVQKFAASQPPAVKGAEKVKAQIIALQNHLDSLSKMTDNDFEKNVIGHRIGDLYTALLVIDRYADFFKTESPTAAGEKKVVRDSKWLIGRSEERWKELERYKWDWTSFYNGWLEGRMDMLEETAAGDGKEAIEFHNWVEDNAPAIDFREQKTHTTAQLYDIFKNRTGAINPEIQYRGPGSHCKACEDEAAGIKHITAAKHTCRKHQNK